MNALSIGILITGSEILDGRVLDTNSHFLIQECEEQALPVRHTLSCGDVKSDIQECLHFLSARVDAIIVSGGLGPTSDDVTTEAMAEFCGEALALREEVLREIEELFRSRKRPMDPSNRKQAIFPISARVLPNPVGTAPGFWMTVDKSGQKRHIFVLPGVPSELRAMMRSTVFPTLKDIQRDLGIVSQKRHSHMFRILGLPESVVGSRVSAVEKPDEVVISYRAHFPEIQVLLKSYADLTSAYLDQLRLAVGAEFIFSEDSTRGLVDAIQMLMCSRNHTLSVAESCTGGLIGSLLTAVPGSSRYFLGGALTYSNALKTNMLRVDPEIIAARGAVSFEVAKEMALGARQVYGSDFAISVTGVAGPEGGSPEKPVGTFFVGFSSKSEALSYHCFVQGSRDRVRTFAAYTALDILRRKILSLPISLPSFGS